MTDKDNEILQSIICSPVLERFHGAWNPECHWVASITLIQLKWMIKQNWIISDHGKLKAKNNFAQFTHLTEDIAFTPDYNTEILLKLII